MKGRAPRVDQLEQAEHDHREHDQAGDAMRQKMIDTIAERGGPRCGILEDPFQQRADRRVADLRFGGGDAEPGLRQALTGLGEPLAQVCRPFRQERLFDVPADVENHPLDQVGRHGVPLFPRSSRANSADSS